MPLETFPVEILREIMVRTVVERYSFSPLPICLVSRGLSGVAFSTPELWQNLSIDPKFHQIDHQLLISRDFLEFIARRYGRLGNGNQFALRFKPTVSRRTFIGKNKGLVPLDQQNIALLFQLFSRARHLEIHHDIFFELYNLRYPEDSVGRWSLPKLESLNIVASESEYFESQLQKILAFSDMPAVRKISLNTPCLDRLDGTRLLDLFPPLASRSYSTKWGQLTHICAKFVITHFQDWKAIISDCHSMERAILILELREPDGLPPPINTSVVTHVNLQELDLTISGSRRVNRQASSLFHRVHLPALETFQLRAAHLTFVGFIGLTTAAPSLKRLRLASLFPTSRSESSKVDEIHVDFLGFPAITPVRLADHAPQLRHIMIDIPYVARFKQSLRPYIKTLQESCWLEGPWKDGPPRFEFYWSSPSDSKMMKPMVADLYRYLLDSGNGLQIEVGLRKWDEAMRTESILGAQGPYWDDWDDIGVTFRAAHPYL